MALTTQNGEFDDILFCYRRRRSGKKKKREGRKEKGRKIKKRLPIEDTA